MEDCFLEFDYFRRFGVEIELNALDGKAGPFNPHNLPTGIHEIGTMVPRSIGEFIQVPRDNNIVWKNSLGDWVIKPDGSCGVEICSPICKGWYGLERICRLVDAIADCDRLKSDARCSFHIHLDAEDCSDEEVANISTYWIKCEPVFMDAMPNIKKNSQYCQFIGLLDIFSHESVYSTEQFMRLLGQSKYYSISINKLYQKDRRTVEFRIGDNDICLNSYDVKNWIKLAIHFFEMAKKRPPPVPYEENNPWSSYLWLDLKEVFELLGFDGKFVLSPGMEQVRNWFVRRLVKNIGKAEVGIQSEVGRIVSKIQLDEIINKYVLNYEFDFSKREELVYGKNYQR